MGKSPFEFKTPQGNYYSRRCVVNRCDYIPQGEYNPHREHCFLLMADSQQCIVVASCLQDALDIAVDRKKLGSLKIEKEYLNEYGLDTDEPTCAFLGNFCVPYDITELRVEEFEELFEE